jgi:hypothetical protein
LVRTQVRIQTCLRRQTGRLITSQRSLNNPIWGETGSLRLREQGKSVWDTSRVGGGGGLSFSQEIATNEVKGWITKKFSSHSSCEEDSQESGCIIHHCTG